MGPLIHTRIANQENIQYSIELKRDQDPAIAPLAYRLGEAQIEQKTIVDHVILNMARGETGNCLVHIHMYKRRTWTRTGNRKADNPIEAICDSGARGDEAGCHKPGDRRPTSAPDEHSYERGHHEPCDQTDSRWKHIIHDTCKNDRST